MMDIKDAAREKRELQRRLHLAIQSEMSTFTAKTGLSIGSINVSLVDCSTVGGESFNILGAVQVDVSL